MPSRRRSLTAAAVGLALVLPGCSADPAEWPDARASPSPAVTGTPGSDGAGDRFFPQAGNGGYDARHYKLDLSFDPAAGERTLSGTSEMTAEATQDLSRFNLDLSGLAIASVTVDGTAAAHTREGTEVTVTPDRPLAKGSVFTVAVAYSGRPKAVASTGGTAADGWHTTRDGALAMGQPLGAMTWFPVNNTVLDPAAYDMALTVPSGLTAVSNGLYRGRSTDAGRSTFRWHNPDPTAPYLVTAAFGRFDLRQSTTDDGLPVVSAVDPEHADGADEVLALIPEMIEWGTERFGPYPFSSAGAIVDHAPDVHFALETLGRPAYADVPDESTMLHEYAHQWFGNAVTVSRWTDIWLNEGFATYAQWLWDEDRGTYTTQQWFDHVYALPAQDGMWAYPPGKPGKPAELFGAATYYRGAMVLHKLRLAVGDDAFYRTLRTWVAERTGGPGTVEQFTALAEEVSGRDLRALFDTWLFGEGKPARP